MALKDSIINLVLKGKDLMTPATKTAADSVGKLQERSDELTTALEKLTKTERNIEQFKKLSDQSDRLKENWQEAEYELQQLKEAFEATEKPTKAMARELEKAEKSAEGAHVAWRRNRDSLDRLTPQLKAAGVNMDNLDQAQDDVQQSAMRLRSDLTGVNVQLDRQEQAAKDAAEETEDLGEKADKSSGLLSKLGSGLKTVAAGATALIAGIGASAATLTVFSRGQASLADELTNTANAIGVNRESLQAWQIAGERVGLTGDKVTDILRSVTERLGEFAATGGGEAAQVMERLNLQIEDFEGLAPDEQMLKFAQAIESLPKSEQVALLEKLGSDASQLQPLLENNAAGLQAIKAAAEEEGAIYTDEELDKLLKANDIYNDITLKIQGLTRRIGAELAPVVADATDKVMDLFDQNEMGEKLIDLFKRLTDWGADMAAKLVENADSISAGFGTLWNTIEAGANGAMAVFRGLQTIVAGWTTLVAGSFATVLSVAEGVSWAMNKVGLVSDETMNSISAKAGAARDTVVDLGKQTAEYGRKAIEAGKGVVGAFDDAAESGRKLKEETEKSVGTLTTLAENVKSTVSKAGEETDKARQKAKDLEGAYKTLGVTAQAELEAVAVKAEESFRTIKASGEASQRELSEAFQAYAQAVIATGDEAKAKALEAEAASLGLSEVLKGLGVVGEETGNKIKSSFEEAFSKANDKDSLKQLEINLLTAASAGEDVSDQLEEVQQRLREIQQLEDGDGVSKPVQQLTDDTEDAGDAAEETSRKFQSSFGDLFSGTMTRAREAVSALSVAARNLFESKIGGNQIAAEAETSREQLELVNGKLYEMQKALDSVRTASWTVTGSGFTRWAIETAQASLEAQQAFYAQAVAMDDLKASIDSGTYSLEELARLSNSAKSRFNLLDDARLDNLQAAIDAAKQKLESLTSTADNTLSSLRQRLADIRGDTEEAQRIQYETERQRLQEQLKLAQQAGADEAAADYQQSLDTLEQIYQIEQKNRREEQNAREREAADRAREQQLAEIERQRAERELGQSTQRTTQARTETVKTVNVNLGGQSFRVLADDQDALLRALENARSTAL